MPDRGLDNSSSGVGIDSSMPAAKLSPNGRMQSSSSRKLFPPRSQSSRKLPPKPEPPTPTAVAQYNASPAPPPAGDPSIPTDPTPEHLNFGTESDDLSNFMPDFSGLDLSDSSLRSSDQSNPRSLGGYFAEAEEEKKVTDESWTEQQALKAAACVPGGYFWRGKATRKVSSADVASVGNASDTVVSVSNTMHMSGRDLHESAKVSLNIGEFTKALQMFEAILTAQIRRFKPMHPSVGAAMHNVGVCRQRMGQQDIAENLFQEAVYIRRHELGGQHLEVAASLSKLGAAQVALHKFEEAFSNLREALGIAKFQLGDKHKTVAQMLCHLACFHYEAGELYASQNTFLEALDIYRVVWANEEDRNGCMAQLTDTLCNIGSIQNRRKRYADAVKSFSEALDLQRGIYGHDHPRIVATLDNLGYSYSKNKDYGVALSCYQQMLRAQVSHSGTFTDACFDTYRKEILMYEKLKRYSEAVEETKETLRLEKQMLPRGHKLISQTKELLEELTGKMERIEAPPVAV